MFSPSNPNFLRTVLLMDAATCCATGLLTTLGAGVVSRLTQLPEGLLLASGASLFPIGAFIAFVATRAVIWPLGVWVVILGNVGWVAASLALLVSGMAAPNSLGRAFVLIQAATVALLGAMEVRGVRNGAALA